MNQKNNSESPESVLGVSIITIACVAFAIGFLAFYRLNLALFWAVIGYALSALIVSGQAKEGISFYKLLKWTNSAIIIFSLCLMIYGLIAPPL